MKKDKINYFNIEKIEDLLEQDNIDLELELNRKEILYLFNIGVLEKIVSKKDFKKILENFDLGTIKPKINKKIKINICNKNGVCKRYSISD